MNTELGIQRVQRGGELATASQAALAKATIEAKFVMAATRPRNQLQARSDILDMCKRPGFAEGARWEKPVGGSTISGLSIRFAEAALTAWGNVDIGSTIIYDDEQSRSVRITVTDLQSNISYSDDVLLSKTIERRNVKPGQEVLAQRVNSYGDNVFIVAATDDEMQVKLGSAKSKAIRNSGLRMIPQDILAEAEDAITATVNNGGGDNPKDKIKKLCDAFAGVGVGPNEITAWLGHAMETISPKELGQLRGMYAAIKDGEASWQDYMDRKGDKSAPDVVPAADKPRRGRPPKSATVDPVPGAEPVQQAPVVTDPPLATNDPVGATCVPITASEQTLDDIDRLKGYIARMKLTEESAIKALQQVYDGVGDTIAEILTNNPEIAAAVFTNPTSFVTQCGLRK